MAYTRIGSVAAASDDAASVTTGALDTTGADLIVAVLSDLLPSTRSVITDSKGNSWTAAKEQSQATYQRCTIFYSRPTSVGSGHTFTATKVDTNTYPTLCIIAFSGSATSPADQSNGASGTSTSTLATGSATPSENNELVIAGVACYVNIASIDGGFTADSIVDGVSAKAWPGAAAYLIQTTAAAANPTWTFDESAASAAAAIVTFKALNTGEHRMFMVF